jgi:hypothetical protein
MKHPVTIRLKVDADLRDEFREAAYRSQQFPSQVIRRLMEGFVEREAHRHAVDLTVCSNIRRAAEHVARMRPHHPPHVIRG